MKLYDRILKSLSLERKQADIVTPITNMSVDPFSHWRRDGSSRRDVGLLELNSLAMAVSNCTALRIPEAVPRVKTVANGEEKIDAAHPCAQLIQRPNKHNTWAVYAGGMSNSWWFAGNVYLYIGSGAVEPSELWYLPHDTVKPRWPDDRGTPDVRQWAREHSENVNDLDPFISHYQFTAPNKQPVLYRADEILHLKRHIDSCNPRLGVGAFESLYEELLGDKAGAKFTASFLSKGGIQVPIIRPKDANSRISPETAGSIKENWMRKTGPDSAGEPVVWDYPVEIDQFGFPPKDIDLSSLRKISEARVCAVCQISPAALQLLVGIENGTSYASSEQARQQVYEEVVIPIQRAWAQAITWSLLKKFKGSEKQEFFFDTSAVRVLQEDTDALYKREAEVFRTGATTVDQFLVSINKKPVGSPIGDLRYVPSTASPTNEEQLIAKSDGSLAPEPIDPNAVDAVALAKFADMERMFESLESQMKGFEVPR